MDRIRTDKAAFGGLVLSAAIFIFLCTAPGIYATAGVRPSLDAMLLSSFIGGIVFALVFAIGHALLRKRARGGRSLYATLGAVSLVLAYASRMDLASLVAAFRHGLVAYFFFLPTVVGSGLGFIYTLRAGWDVVEPDIDDIATPASAEAASAPALIETDSSAYFAGPVRVRTSPGLMFLAALIGGGALFGARALLGLVGEARMVIDQGAPAVLRHSADMSLAFSVEMIGLTFLALIPITLGLIAGHFAARAFKTTTTGAYFLLGFAAPLVLTVLGPGPFLMVGLTLTFPTAISLALYRRFAGLEPMPVAEDVIVTDPTALVGKDHARRRYGRVIQQPR